MKVATSLVPHEISSYDDCLVKLELYAAKIGGRIRGVVSYETFDAYIYLDLPFHEFTPDRMDDLRFIANNARSVCFSTIEDDMIRLSVRFSYFENIGDVDAIIEEELKKHPELCEKLEDTKDDEVEQILANPLLVAMIEPQAEKAGMTVEYYVRLIDTMLHARPEIFMDLLNKTLKDRHEGFSKEE